MVICPVAIAVGCKKCPIFKVCPVKGVIGDYKPPEASAAPTRSAETVKSSPANSRSAGTVKSSPAKSRSAKARGRRK